MFVCVIVSIWFIFPGTIFVQDVQITWARVKISSYIRSKTLHFALSQHRSNIRKHIHTKIAGTFWLNIDTNENVLRRDIKSKRDVRVVEVC